MSKTRDFKHKFDVLQSRAEDDWATALLETGPDNDPCATHRRLKHEPSHGLLEPDDEEQSKQMAVVVGAAVKATIDATKDHGRHDVEVPTPWGVFRGGTGALILLIAALLAAGWFWLRAHK